MYELFAVLLISLLLDQYHFSLVSNTLECSLKGREVIGDFLVVLVDYVFAVGV